MRWRLTASATVAVLTIASGTAQAAAAVERPAKSAASAADAAALIEALTPAGNAPDVVAPKVKRKGSTSVTADRTTVSLPTDPADPIVITASDGSSLGIGLPVTPTMGKAELSARGTAVYRDSKKHGGLAAQALDNGGARALITIPDAAAPHEYSFRLTSPAGVAPQLQADGSVLLSDSDGNIHGGLDAPWAKDAAGNDVPTRFSLTGHTVTQHIDVSAVTAFPVVADPEGWWGWAKCTAAIGALVAGNLLIATKVRKLGGIPKIVQTLKEARNAQERYKALLYFFGEFAGINAVITNCR